MRINNDIVNQFKLVTVDRDCEARTTPISGGINAGHGQGFDKMMVFYRHGKPVWAHRDCLPSEQEQSLAKFKKKGLTKRKKKV